MIIPLIGLAMGSILGADHDSLIVPYAIAQIVGIFAYVDHQKRRWR